MEVTPKSRFILRFQALVFFVFFLGIIGLLAWLSTRYVYQADWTKNARNTVSVDTRRLLDELDEPVFITAFSRQNNLLREQIRDLVGRYQRHKQDISLGFINPDTDPERVRELGITVDGELLISYEGRSDKIQQLSEQKLTNALLRISRRSDRWITFLSGHGERMPDGQANHDYGVLGKELERQGIGVQSINLVETVIPSNTHLLVIAGPQVDLLPGEIRQILNYIEAGGNLWWLAEPGEERGLTPLAEELGIEFLPGMVVDASTQLFGIQDPAIVVIPDYPLHPATQGLNAISLFPHTTGLETGEGGPWQVQPLLTTLERTWTETSELVGDIAYDPDSDERPGPLDIAISLSRDVPEGSAEGSGASREQRIIVVGDGDFLSNAYIGNAGNLKLGLNMAHWLSHDDAYINILPRAASDQQLQLGQMQQALIAFGFLVVLPLLLMIIGLVIWMRRRRR